MCLDDLGLQVSTACAISEPGVIDEVVINLQPGFLPAHGGIGR
jgi:hypothetical protein